MRVTFSVALAVLIQTQFNFALAVVNGVRAKPGQFRSTVMLRIYSNTQSPICTGTYISAHHILTAAHCVPEKNMTVNVVQNWIGTRQGEETDVVHVLDYKVHEKAFYSVHDPDQEKCRNASVNENSDRCLDSSHDLAVLLVEEASPFFSPLNTKPLRHQTKIHVAGFGCTDLHKTKFDQWLEKQHPELALRSGTNTIDEILAGTFSFRGKADDRKVMGIRKPDGKLVLTCPGDSGGAVFDESGTILGVSSTYDSIDSEKTRSSSSTFARVDEPENMKFIATEMAELKAP